MNNTKKITYAMKLVSAAKLRRAQESVHAARQYTDSLNELVKNVLQASDGEELTHPLMEDRESVARVRILVVGGSRGLCGAYNTNVNKRLSSAIRELRQRYSNAEIDTYVLGKKPREHVVREKIPHVRILEDLSEDALSWPIEEIARNLEDAFLSGEVDRVYLLFIQFRSAMSQSPVLEQILPLRADTLGVQDSSSEQQLQSLMIFEPSPEKVFEAIVPRILRTRIQQAGLDAKASEHGSRMVAMDSATKNAGELSRQLTLKHNKLRQGAITAELLDIIGGAEAIR